MKLTAGIAIICLGAALSGCGNTGNDGKRTIRVSGNIELNEVQIAFKPSGRLVERAVDEGDTVKKGMVIARLDRDQLLRQKEREQAALAAAQAMLSQAETAAKWQGQALQAEMRAANADLAKAIAANHAYTPQVQAAVDRFHRAMGELQKETILHVLAMRAVLTPQQAAKFDETVAKSLTEDGQ